MRVVERDGEKIEWALTTVCSRSIFLKFKRDVVLYTLRTDYKSTIKSVRVSLLKRKRDRQWEREERGKRTSKSGEVSSQRKLGKKSTAEKLKVPMLSAFCMLSRDIKNAESTACTYIVSISVVTYVRKKKKKKEGNCRQQFRCKFEGFFAILNADEWHPREKTSFSLSLPPPE